jgi:hypothetical protein
MNKYFICQMLDFHGGNVAGGTLCRRKSSIWHFFYSRGLKMKKKQLSFDDHLLIAYYLKSAHLAMIRTGVLLANKNGKNKPPFQTLRKLQDELLGLRSDIDDLFYKNYFHEHGEIAMRQRYFGPLDRKLQLNLKGKNIFSR